MEVAVLAVRVMLPVEALAVELEVLEVALEVELVVELGD